MDLNELGIELNVDLNILEQRMGLNKYGEQSVDGEQSVEND